MLVLDHWMLVGHWQFSNVHVFGSFLVTIFRSININLVIILPVLFPGFPVRTIFNVIKCPTFQDYLDNKLRVIEGAWELDERERD